MTIDELLCKFQGKCWHEWEWNIPEEGIPPYVCLLCGYRAKDASRLDYADDHTAMELLRWMYEERGDMLTAFVRWSEWHFNYIYLLTAWEKEIEGKSYMRWVVLLAEWLRLEEVREKWGTERCPNDFMAFTSHDMCPVCNGSGKLLAPWLEERLANA